MNLFDWLIMGAYLVGMVALGAWLGRGQKSESDYFLAGKNMHWFPIGVSTMATQLSTNSLLGAPAFVAFSLGGGLVWLQYELAVPLAMIFIMVFIVPFFRRAGVISVYEYLEQRFGGVGTRTLLSVLFQFMVAFGTGVTVYGISLVLEAILVIPFWMAVTLLGVVTIIYDTVGGMKGVIASDVIQMFVLLLGVVLITWFAVDLTGGLSAVVANFDEVRRTALDFTGHGLGDGATFAFLPMLVGGFFLYVSYYGCNQTQVQRQLAAKDNDDTNMALFLNGVLRFPIVLSYCFMGVAVGAFATSRGDFLEMLPMREVVQNGVIEQVPNFNMAVPAFVLEYLPHGAIGLIIVALFAAAMSSLDSTINSLSATTVRDIIDRFFKPTRERSQKQKLLISRGTTVFWGAACVTFSFFVGDMSDSIIVTINKIGSLVNGPLLATFLLAILTKRTNDRGAVIGILAGFSFNLFLWVAVPGVSWLWWNVTGCAVTFAVGYGVSLMMPAPSPANLDELTWSKGNQFDHKKNWNLYYGLLVAYFVVMMLVLIAI